ncbi:MAG: Ig-like domain-containing protein [Ignavibacteria bacterium]|nr:Ig-like domain-containing protein [Ignavibacteria bacterium]
MKYQNGRFMKIHFILFLLFIFYTTNLTAQSKLNVNLIGGSSDSYLLNDIDKIVIIKNTVSVESITIEVSNIELKKNENYQLNYNIVPENATNKSVTWSSSNNNVATVDNNGLVTAISEGSATIEVETEDGKLKDIVEVIVSPTTSVETANINIKIYPNPIENRLVIETGDILKYEVVLSDISGNILYSEFDKNEIDFSIFSSGNYFLTLIANNKYYNFKLIKK